MSLTILNEQPENGVLSIKLDNGDYRILKEIVKKWKFKDQESALRFALAVLDDTEEGSLCKNKGEEEFSILRPTSQMKA